MLVEKRLVLVMVVLMAVKKVCMVVVEIVALAEVV